MHLVAVASDAYMCGCILVLFVMFVCVYLFFFFLFLFATVKVNKVVHYLTSVIVRIIFVGYWIWRDGINGMVPLPRVQQYNEKR